MGNIKKIGDTYYIEFYARGLLYSQVAGSDEKEALKLLEATEKKIASGEMLTVVREISYVAFFEQFLVHIQDQYSDITQGRFAQLILHFSEFLSVAYPSIKYISQITPKVVESYKDAWVKKTRPHKINFSILLLREIMEHGIKLGFINDNPTIHVALLSLPQKSLKRTPRFEMAQQLLGKSVTLGKAVKLLKLTDIARVMYFSNLIPLKREEMYN